MTLVLRAPKETGETDLRSRAVAQRAAPSRGRVGGDGHVDRPEGSIRQHPDHLRRGRVPGSRSRVGIGQEALHRCVGRSTAGPGGAVPGLGRPHRRVGPGAANHGHGVRLPRRRRSCVHGAGHRRTESGRASPRFSSLSRRRTRASRDSSPTASCWRAALARSAVAIVCGYLFRGHSRSWLFVRRSGRRHCGLLEAIRVRRAARRSALPRRRRHHSRAHLARGCRRMRRAPGRVASVLAVLFLHGLVVGLGAWWYAIAGYRLEGINATSRADWQRFWTTAHLAAADAPAVGSSRRRGCCRLGGTKPANHPCEPARFRPGCASPSSRSWPAVCFTATTGSRSRSHSPPLPAVALARIKSRVVVMVIACLVVIPS